MANPIAAPINGAPTPSVPINRDHSQVLNATTTSATGRSIGHPRGQWSEFGERPEIGERPASAGWFPRPSCETSECTGRPAASDISDLAHRADRDLASVEVHPDVVEMHDLQHVGHLRRSVAQRDPPTRRAEAGT